MKQSFYNTKSDCEWLRDTHLAPKNLNNANPIEDFQSFVLFGNEDSPSKIVVYRKKHPSVDDVGAEANLVGERYSFFDTKIARRNPAGGDTALMRRRAAQYSHHATDTCDLAVRHAVTGRLAEAAKLIKKLPARDAHVALANKLEDAKVAGDASLAAAIGFLQGNLHR